MRWSATGEIPLFMRLCTEYAYLPAIDADGRKQAQERMETSAPALIFFTPSPVSGGGDFRCGESGAFVQFGGFWGGRAERPELFGVLPCETRRAVIQLRRLAV